MSNSPSEPVTIMALAAHILGRDATNGADYAEAQLPMMGGCEVCGATIAAYNACPSRSGYLRCANGCIGDTGYGTVEQARAETFGRRDRAAERTSTDDGWEERILDAQTAAAERPIPDDDTSADDTHDYSDSWSRANGL